MDMPVLRLVSDQEILTIDETNGTESIATADFFTGGIDPSFIRWHIDDLLAVTPKKRVAVYVLAQDATFMGMFNSVTDNLDQLFFTQSQILNFIGKYSKWVPTDGWATFFPLKSCGKYFTVGVGADSRLALCVDIRPLVLGGVGYVWRVSMENRIVLPVDAALD